MSNTIISVFIYLWFSYSILFFALIKVIVGSCVLLYISFAVQSYPQGYGGGNHDEEEHVDYYVSIHPIQIARAIFSFQNTIFIKTACVILLFNAPTGPPQVFVQIRRARPAHRRLQNRARIPRRRRGKGIVQRTRPGRHPENRRVHGRQGKRF